MTLSVKYQDSYSRGQLLLRTFFGWLYIAIPHFFLLLFIGIWGAILQFVAWWVVLFTGKYPQGWFEFQVKLQKWGLRVSAQLYNLTDEGASFGLDGTSESTSLEIPYPETLSRGKLLLRTFLGIFYLYIPHLFLLYFRLIGAGCVMFVAWWIVLFTGSYPANMHGFVLGTLRWMIRFQLYSSFMTDDYPPFSGKE